MGRPKNARDMLMAMLADLIRIRIDDATRFRFRFPSGQVTRASACAPSHH